MYHLRSAHATKSKGLTDQKVFLVFRKVYDQLSKPEPARTPLLRNQKTKFVSFEWIEFFQGVQDKLPKNEHVEVEWAFGAIHCINCSHL